MLVTGAIAVVTNRPYIFPSLGPTAILIFGYPAERTSAPRNVLFGHAIGAGCGYLALWATGEMGVPFSPHVNFHRTLAAAMALALTALLMHFLRCEHAPAGATTLIVALGVLPTLGDFAWLMLAVATLILIALAANRSAGIPYPLWGPPTER